ncbi:MAG: sugar ABC transporter permease [Candidatus Thermoplasmatota archaeon]|nr:sugar ABC transporter permease [Candidatus Thermoplasmatota archaeon]
MLSTGRQNKKTVKLNDGMESRYGYILIAPLLLLIVVFIFFPAFYSFAISLFYYNPFGHQIHFAGISNYAEVLHSSLFAISVLNVMYYTAVVVTLQTILAFSLAMLFNYRFRITRMSRALVFVPAITSPVALSIIFIWVFSRQGMVNYFLSMFGVQPINFFFSTTFAFPAIMAMNIFSTAPYFMVMYLAGLQAIPPHILEAASLDGIRSGWKRFRYIYAPMLSFTTFLVVVLGVIGSMQLFDQVFVITGGGPANSTYVPLIYIYNRAFLYFGTLGVSSAASFILFAVIMAVTLLQRRYLKELRWA